MKQKFFLGILFLTIVLIGFGSNFSFTNAASSGWAISDVTGYGLPYATLTNIAKGVLTWILTMFGVFGILGFLVSGVMYLLAFGSDDAVKRAKKGMEFSIIGILVGLSGLIIIYAIDWILRGYTNF